MSGYIFLASYPKSGNTWLRFMLETVRRNGQPPNINEIGIANASARGFLDRAFDLETSDLSPTEIARGRHWVMTAHQKSRDGQARILKVHDANLPPPGDSSPIFAGVNIDRVVYIVRDPRDVVVSAAAFFGHSLKKQVEYLNDPMFMLGRSGNSLNLGVEQLISSWSKHVASWLGGVEYPLLLVHYEDMLANTQRELERITRFLGFPIWPEILFKTVEASRFSVLAAQESVHGFRERNRQVSTPFFRRGIAGGWRDVLSRDLVASILREQGGMMKELGYET